MTMRWTGGQVAMTVCVGALVLGAAWPAGAAALDRTALDAALQKVREDTGAPAAAASIMRCGRPVWSGVSGETVLGSGRKATLDSRVIVASTTKPMIAALVLDLVDKGKLTLETPLARFYPKLPGAKTITIRMLLDHTSGLSEYFDDPRIAKLITDEPAHKWTRAEVLRGVTKLVFAPGSKYEYSNSNYVVLGGVVEKLAKSPIERVFRARIGDPLRLENTTFEYRPDRSKLFAHPYLGAKGSLRDAFVTGVGIPTDYWGPVWTDGGLASTAPELARVIDALLEGRIVRPKVVRTMTRPNRFGHGLGVDPVSFAGSTWIGHSGGYAGYGAQVWYDTKRRTTIAVTTTSDGSAVPVWAQIVLAYDAQVSPEEPARCPGPAR